MQNIRLSRLKSLLWAFCAMLLLGLALPAPAAAQDEIYPEVIDLPNGWLPEGIAIGTGHTFYAGSRADGAVYRGDLRTGAGEVFVEGEPGRVAVGLKYSQRCDLLIVSGGGTGNAYLYDGTTGELVKTYSLSSAPVFINDVVVTNDAAYFTNSSKAEIYKVDLSDCGNLPDSATILPLSGDWQQLAGFNANGIVADQSGKTLIIVNSTLGTLYRVDPLTGEAGLIDLGGQSVSLGDGLLLHGQTLFVVRNRLNEVLAIQLNNDWSAGEVLMTITHPMYDVPTTVGIFGNALYAVNARFTTPPTPDTEYTAVRVELNSLK